APCDDALACMLNRRVHLALETGEEALARRTFEERLAYALDGGFAAESRVRLEEIAQLEIDRGRRDAALRIVRYLWPQPKDPLLAQLLKQQREALSANGGPLVAMTPVASPWDPAPRTAR
ncbi:MAG TPA: hypothetical protein VG777_05580, partial [Thermoanaerobaculia bacterium]|nr:hypothetical protein [Thermoanaerobaculia bacterium]